MNGLYDFSNARIANLGTPTDDQLNLINKIAPKPIRAEDIFVFGSHASNSDYDNFHSVMDDSSLNNYAIDFKDSRAFLAHHDDKDFPLGRTFDSVFESAAGLNVATYVTRGLHINKVAADDFIRAVETGICKDVSIRYNNGEEVCELCHNRVLSRSCDHMPGVRYDGKLATYRIIDGHAVEMSTVFKGSNPKTSILKARELYQRGFIDDKALSQWNLQHSCDIRADMERPDIIQLSKDMDLADNLRTYFTPLETSDTRSYLERFNVTMDKTRDEKNGKDPSGDECGTPGCTLKKGHDGAHNTSKERAFKGTDSEKKICDIFMDWVQTRGATTSPENLASIKDFLERAEKGEHPKPPYQAMVDKEDDDDDDHDNEGKNKEVKRHLAPVRSFSSITEFLKTRSESYAGPMGTMAKGTPDAFSKGHTAGLLYPSAGEPLQNAPSETWHLVDGSPTPDDADKGAGAGVASISNPLIEIRPDGTISLLLDGGAKVHGEASANGIVPMRMEGSDTIEDVPFKSAIVPFRAEHLQELVGLASEGLFYRRSLEFDGVRYGMARDAGKFDAELHIRIMRSLPSLNDLREYVDTLKQGAARKLAVDGVADKALSEFGLIPSRQSAPNQGLNPSKVPSARTEAHVESWDAYKV